MGAGTSAGDAARPRRGTRQAPEADGQAVMEPGPVPAGPETPAGPAVPGDGEPSAGGAPSAGGESTVTVGRTAGTESTVAVAGTESTGHTAPSDPDETGTSEQRGRRFSLTEDTARPEGGGRAAPSDAPAPARQWPLLSVLGTTALGLLIVGTHPFAEAFRVGTILIGVALIGGAVLRRVLPSVGMLAVRSRYTDMLTYGLLGLAIVLLSLMTQPKPWLEIPFLEDVVHSSVP
ncbi:DUF3017 domain-containing protein [Streptomyces sp. NPDC051662]|uniref:DUF3017 domain-containing protein n=1 Tax=Streptomyces sp. NPDC051662 TaxID=3154750 RepID=UPI003447CE32